MKVKSMQFLFFVKLLTASDTITWALPCVSCQLFHTVHPRNIQLPLKSVGNVESRHPHSMHNQ